MCIKTLKCINYSNFHIWYDQSVSLFEDFLPFKKNLWGQYLFLLNYSSIIILIKTRSNLHINLWKSRYFYIKQHLYTHFDVLFPIKGVVCLKHESPCIEQKSLMFKQKMQSKSSFPLPLTIVHDIDNVSHGGFMMPFCLSADLYLFE